MLLDSRSSNASSCYTDRAGMRKKYIKLSIGVELKEQVACSLKIGRAPKHDTMDFRPIMERVSNIMPLSIVVADKGYDAEFIRKYLTKRKISDCIPYRKNSKTQQQNDNTEQYLYGKTRYVVERFFAWLKNGFHRTRIRYEKNAQNYLAFVIISSIMMYWRVLG